MISHFTRYTIRPLILLLALATSIQVAQAAPNANITFSPNKTSLGIGEQVTVTLNAAVNEFTAGSVSVAFTYDANKLEYQSVDDSGSAFPNQYSFSAANGSASIIRFTNPSGATGTSKITGLVFKTKQAGTAALAFGDTKIYELGTGASKTVTTSNSSITVTEPNKPKAPTIQEFSANPTKITKGNATQLKWRVDDAASVSIDHGVGGVSSNSDRSVSPTTTTKYTLTAQSDGGTTTRDVTVTVENPTTTPAPTQKPTATPTAKPSTAATTAPVTSDVSASLSSVTYSNTTALADGVDAITVTVDVRSTSGSPLSDAEPTLAGLRETGDAASPFVYDTTAQTWSSTITSTTVGEIIAVVTAKDVVLDTTTLTFTEAVPTTDPSPTVTEGGGGFGRTLLVGFIVLLLLLILLAFLWRKLRHHDDEYEEEVATDEAAFPGDETATAEATTTEAAVVPVPVQQEDEEASFDPNATLQRKEETPPPAAPAPPPAPPKAETPPPAQ